jgi:hypothetical protein
LLFKASKIRLYKSLQDTLRSLPLSGQVLAVLGSVSFSGQIFGKKIRSLSFARGYRDRNAVPGRLVPSLPC